MSFSPTIKTYSAIIVYLKHSHAALYNSHQQFSLLLLLQSDFVSQQLYNMLFILLFSNIDKELTTLHTAAVSELDWE